MQDTTPSCPFNIFFHGTVGEKSKTSPGLTKYNIILNKNLKCFYWLIPMNYEKVIHVIISSTFLPLDVFDPPRGVSINGIDWTSRSADGGNVKTKLERSVDHILPNIPKQNTL
jgi:hypothetical protein